MKMEIQTTPKQEEDAALIGAYWLDMGRSEQLISSSSIFHAALAAGLSVLVEEATEHFGEDLLQTLSVSGRKNAKN